MPQNLDTSLMAQIADISFEDFKTAYQNGNYIAANYYNAMKSAAQTAGLQNVANYADLATGVIYNDTVSGMIANAYANEIASDNGIGFAVGSDNWLQMQHELMQRDLTARQENGSNGELDYSDISQIHSDALQVVGLPPETYTLHTPLKNLGDADSDLAQTLFEDMIAPDGSGGNPLQQVLAADALNGMMKAVTPEYYQWAKNLADAFASNPGLMGAALADSFDDTFVPWEDMPSLGDWLQNVLEGFNFVPSPEQEAIDALNGYPYQIINDAGGLLGSPLVLDLDNDGVELVSYENSWAWFDITETGFASRTGWVKGDDGLLAIDSNSNGKIDDNGELFGSLTEDGFTELAVYDTNSDGKIDANDAQFSDLKIWQDMNANGQTETGELQSLAYWNITEITINTTPLQNSYELDGAEITHESTFKINGQDQLVVDAWFEYSNLLNFYEDTSPLATGVDVLPNMRGFGQVKDLHRAMSDDATLKVMVEGFMTDHADLDDVTDLRADFRDILYRWAGVDGIDPESRGTAINDARDLEFLETYLQQSFNGNEIGAVDPDYSHGGQHVQSSSFRVQQSFEALSQKLLYNFMAQANTTLAGVLDYNPAINRTQLKADMDITDLENAAPTANAEAVIYWMYIAKSAGVNPYMMPDIMEKIFDLQTHATTDASYVFNLLTTGTNGAGNYASVMDDISVGTSGDDITGNVPGPQFSLSGNDIIYSGAGNDSIGGWKGDDILIGGAGDDYVSGGEGNDIFVYNITDGSDVISCQDSDHDSIDVLYMGAGIAEGDLSYVRDGQDLIITIAANNETITLQGIYENQYGGGADGTILNALLEYIHLHDGTVINVAEVMGRPDINILHDPYGESGNTQLYGTHYFNDTIYGEGGDDGIYGYGGDDIIYGGDGDDNIYGGDGNDLVYGDAGDDRIESGDGDDVVYGGDGDDDIYSGDGDDIIYGGNGADHITAREGSDIIYGGAGNDQLTTGHSTTGDYETVIFIGQNDGNDILNTQGGSHDYVQFGAGINFEDISFQKSNNHLILTNNVTGQITQLSNTYFYAYGSPNYEFEEVRFDDGTVLDTHFLKARGTSYLGTSGNDTLTGNNNYASALYGYEGDDILNGRYRDDYISDGLGNDTMSGNIGEDRFSITKEAGATDTITDFEIDLDLEQIDLSGFDSIFDSFADFKSGIVQSGSDTHIDLGAGQTLVLEDITATDLSAKHFRGNAGLNTAPTAVNDSFDADDKTTVSGNLLSNDSDIDDDGISVVAGQIVSDQGGMVLLREDGSFTYVAPENYSGDDSFSYTIQDDLGDTNNATVSILNVDRGATTQANATLGHDVYTIGTSDPDLYIDEIAGFDKIEFSAGISSSDISYFLVNTTDLLMTNAVSGRTILINDYYAGENDRIEKIVFNNGDYHDREYILSQTKVIYGGEGYTATHGTSEDEYLETTNDTSTIYAGAGNDILYSEVGGGLLGEDGDDLIISLADSAVWGGAGADIIRLGISPIPNTYSHLHGFDVNEGDQIDLSMVFGHISSFSSLDIHDYISLEDHWSGSELFVDIDGGGDNFVKIAHLSDLPEEFLDVQHAYDNGHIIVNEYGNDIPHALDDSFTGIEDQQLSGNLFADNGHGADFDPNADSLTALAGTYATEQGGTVTVSANGNFVYTPLLNYNGTDSFTYILNDGHGGKATGHVVINLSPSSDAPIAYDDFYYAGKNSLLNGNVLDNGDQTDLDPDGDSLTVQDGTFSTAQGGTIVLLANGDFEYTPANNFYGEDTFTYDVTDGTYTSQAMLCIKVENGEYTVFHGSSSGESLSGTSGDDMLHGHAGDDYIYGNGGDDLIYLSAGTDYINGGDGADTFTFTQENIYDGVDYLNDVDFSEGDTLDISNVLTGVSSVSSLDIADYAEIITNSSYTDLYLDIDGGGDNFLYVARLSGITGFSDAQDLLDNGYLVFNEAGNEKPVATEDSFSGSEDQQITGNVIADNGNGADSDPESQSLTIKTGTFTTDEGGSVTISPNGNFVYTPAANFNGTDQFHYTINDGHGGYARGLVTLNVAAVNDAPVAQDDAFGSIIDFGLNGNVLTDNGNGVDSDVDNDTLTVQTGIFLTVQGGTIEFFANGDFDYTPAASFTGTDTVTYTVYDGNGGSDQATLTIEVSSVAYNFINGTASSDYLNGTSGDDSLDGKAGDDSLYGNAGHDRYIWNTGDGNDTISDSSGTDYIAFGEGITADDIRFENYSSYSLRVYIGSEYITLSNQFSGSTVETAVFEDNSTLSLTTDLTYKGTVSADNINGRADNNIMIGLEGADTLYGNAGNDTYVWNIGDGNDTFSDSSGTDHIEFGTGITADDIRFENYSSYSLRVYIGSEYITLSNQFSGSTIETAVFADNSTLSLTTDLTYKGTTSADNINGRADNNIMIGLEGNDTLYGNAGNDTYVWNIGDGNDTISDSSGSDHIEFGAGITAEDIRFENYSSYNLRVYVGSEYITLSNQFSGSTVETAVFADSSTLNLTMNLTYKGTASADNINGRADNNIMIGLEGNDTLYGNAGDDTYVWNIGDGNDTISDSAGTDKILFGNGINADDIRFEASGSYDLKVHIGSETITVSNHFSGSQIETVELADSTVMDLTENLTFTGTDSGETINGKNDDNILIGLDGNDYLYGNGGDDILYGGDGSDQLNGGSGADRFVFEDTTAFNDVDTVSGFSVSDGDALDISDLLTGYDPLTDALADFVEITDSGSHTHVSVDLDGAGSVYGMTQIATLSYVTGLTDEDALAANGNLIIA